MNKARFPRRYFAVLERECHFPADGETPARSERRVELVVVESNQQRRGIRHCYVRVNPSTPDAFRHACAETSLRALDECTVADLEAMLQRYGRFAGENSSGGVAYGCIAAAYDDAKNYSKWKDGEPK